ncbi:MAG: hypothetical protein RR084_08470, partial [Bacteroidales bacterium]
MILYTMIAVLARGNLRFSAFSAFSFLHFPYFHPTRGYTSQRAYVILCYVPHAPAYGTINLSLEDHTT